MISHAYELCCDECGKLAYYIFPNKQCVKAKAGADGWVIHKNKLCFCREAHFMKWWLERNCDACE